MANPVSLRLGLVTLAATAATAMLLTRNRDRANHDAAPARTARRMQKFGEFLVVGSTVTINASPDRIVAFWQTSPELWQTCEILPFPEGSQPGLLMTPPALRELSARPLLIRIVTEKAGELIAWRSDAPDHGEIHGRMRFRDNGTKGTSVEVILAVLPRDFKSALQTDGMVSSKIEMGLLRDLRRMKMLMEANEIATARNRRPAA